MSIRPFFRRFPVLLAGVSLLCLSGLRGALGAIIPLESADLTVANAGGAQERNGGVAMRADGGGFVVVWEAPDANGTGIYYRRYDANWQQAGGITPVNTVSANNQQSPRVGMDAEGNFVIVWESFGQDAGDSASQSGVYARRYLANGTAIDAAEFRVNTTTLSQQVEPAVAVNASGQFVVAFTSGTGAASILAQSYAGITVGGSGAPATVGSEAVVKDGSLHPANLPAVAIGSAGNYIVTYQTFGQDTVSADSFGIYLQQMNQTGTPAGALDLLVNNTTAGNQQSPDIAMDGSGNFNVVWQSDGIDGSGTAIVMRRFDASGGAFGPESPVNTGITLNNQTHPHITASAGGRFVVSWTGEEADGNSVGTDIFYKAYNSAGTVVIGDTAISPTTVSDDTIEEDVRGAIDTAGDFVFAFQNNSTGDPGVSIHRFGEDPDVSFAAASSSGSESANAAIAIVRTGAPYVMANVATGVQVTRTGGTATPGSDFATTFPNTVNFAAGSASSSLLIAIVDDVETESDETIALSFGTVTNGTATGQTTHTYTILDNEPKSLVSVGDVSVTEGDFDPMSLALTQITFTVSLSVASTSTVTMDYATADGTAVAGSDYFSTSGTLTFTPGETSKTVTVLVTRDSLFENDETFFLNLTNVTNATVADGQAVGTILNDDPAPSLSVADVTLSEGNSGTTAFNFTVTLSAPSGKTVMVNFATADGTATTSNSDYAATSGTLTFNSGETTKTVTVLVAGDTRVESAETFSLQLSSPTNATLLVSAATGTIANDDVPVVTPGAIVIPQAPITITINGSSFDPNPANNAVAFNLGTAGIVLSCTTTSLTVSLATEPTTGGTLTAVVTIAGVSSGAPVAVAVVDAVPDVQDDIVLLDPKQPSVDIDALANDSDSGGDTLTITAVSTPANGTATIIDGGQKIRYEAAGAAAVSDTFSYTVTDSHGTTATANIFVGDRRTAQAGSYHGLIQPALGTTPSNERAGAVTVTVSGTSGKFTARLKIAGKSYAASGTFGTDGVARFGKTSAADFAVKRRNASELRLALRLVVAPVIVKLEGELTEAGAPFAAIAAERALYTAKKNPAAPFENVPPALLGKYTVAFVAKTPADQGLAANLYPQGHGWGFLSVEKSGAVRLTATLADGTKITSTNPLTITGRWPFYTAVAGGQGSLSGFVLFRDQPGVSDLDSLDVQWFKPANAKAKYYPAGWADGIRTDLLGSKLVIAPATAPASILPGLTATDADGNAGVEFTDGNLPGGDFDKALNITGQDLVTVVTPGADQLVLTLRKTVTTVPKFAYYAYDYDTGIFRRIYREVSTLSNPPGAFKGGFLPSPGAKTASFRGVVLQKQNHGFGFFLGAEESGAVGLRLK